MNELYIVPAFDFYLKKVTSVRTVDTFSPEFVRSCDCRIYIKSYGV